MIRTVLLYWQTIKRLTFSQLWWRFVYTCRRRRVEVCGRKVFDRIAREIAPIVQERVSTDFLCATGTGRTYYKGDIERLFANEFTFLNHTVRFGKKVQWHRSELAKGTRLWKLTINYQEYLVDIANRWREEGADSRWGLWFEEHVREWMKQNPLGTKGYGLDNWNSYAISLRIVSWIRAYALVGSLMSNDFRHEYLTWLAVQGRFLGENIEFDILGNHIVKNWKALMWAGVFFKDDWMQNRGREIFKRFVLPQFTDAGMHEELSPMYAAIVLGDMRDVIDVVGRADKELVNAEQKLALCLGYLSFGNEWARFNDSCGGMAPSPECFAINDGFFSFEGYVGGRYSDWHWIADCGAPVIGRQPGHAHCDALSFEFSRCGEKFFTNAGVYEYNPGERRVYSRSSGAHNTLSIKGHEQHEMWKAFRCGRLGNASGLQWNHGDSVDTWRGEFLSFDKFYRHKRAMSISRDKIICEDTLTSAERCVAALNFHLMPEFYARKTNQDISIFRKDGDSLAATIMSEGGIVSVVQMPYFREYGSEEMSDVVSIAINDGQSVKTEIVFR